MIIKKEVFNNYTEEEIKDLCKWYNENVKPTFSISDNKFWVSEIIGIPLNCFSYKKDILREYFMTEEEYHEEAKNWSIEGIFIDKFGRECF